MFPLVTQLLGGLGVFFLVCDQGYSFRAGMEDLTKSLTKLSLLENEGDKLDLSKRKKSQGFVLATKFYTRRSVNLEVVAKTFRPLWCTKHIFEVSDAGDNMLLFAFETVEDVEKVLLGEPWSFD